MKSLPIYDETAPIACTITEAEIPQRVALVERMRANMIDLKRAEHGIVLRFPNRAEVNADLQAFIVDEKRCCQFWGFEIIAGDDITLRWDAPPDAGPILDHLTEWFHGSGSLSKEIAGLL